MGTCKFLIPALLIQLILIHEIAGLRNLVISNQSRGQLIVHCLSRTDGRQAVDEIKAEKNMSSCIVQKRKQFSLTRLSKDGSVACEFNLNLSNNFDGEVIYKGSALVLYKEDEGGNFVKWNVTDAGFFRDTKLKGFRWVRDKMTIWPYSLWWAEADDLEVELRLKTMLNRFSYFPRGIVGRIFNEDDREWTVRCVFAFTKNGNRVSWMRQEWTIQGGSAAHIRLPICVMDEGVVCEFVQSQSGLKKHALLYEPGFSYPLYWSICSDGLFLNEEEHSKFNWKDRKVPGWPLTLWVDRKTKTTKNAKNTLRSLFSNFRKHQHLFQVHDSKRKMTKQCSIHNGLPSLAYLICLRSALDIRARYQQFNLDRHAKIDIRMSPKDYMLCQINTHIALPKYVLFGFPTDLSCDWSLLENSGIVLTGEGPSTDLGWADIQPGRPVVIWDDPALGWPLSLWFIDPELDWNNTLMQLFMNHLAINQEGRQLEQPPPPPPPPQERQQQEQQQPPPPALH